MYSTLKQGEKGLWVSIIAYIGLSLVKLYIGFISGSEALIADGFNNTTDIIASVALLIGVKISQKPPDDDHQYGHFRAETIAALVASFIMMAVGLQVVYHALFSAFDPARQTPNVLAAWTALFCAVVMFAVYLYNLRLGQQLNSQALIAAAMDNRSDALVSIGACIGIFGSQFNLAWLDPLTAIIVGIIICKTAWDIFKDCTHALTDGFDEQKLDEYKKTIEHTRGVDSIKEIKARVHGNNVLVDVVVQLVHDHFNVVESHLITEEIERRMWAEHNIVHVHIHIEPKET